MLVTFYHFKSNFQEVLSYNFKTSPFWSFLLDRLKKQTSKACIDCFGFIEISPLTPSTRSKIQKINYFGFTHASSKVHFCSTEGQTFYWSIMTADDSIKCQCANSGMTGQVGGFQNPWVCLQAFFPASRGLSRRGKCREQAFPSFPPHPLPALLLVPFFARQLILVPCSLLIDCTETLAMQATRMSKE